MARINLDADFIFFNRQEFNSFCSWLSDHEFEYNDFYVPASDNWEYGLDQYNVIIYNYVFMDMTHVSEILDRYRFDFRSTEKDVRQSQ